MKEKEENKTQKMIEDLAENMAVSFTRLQQYMDKRFEKIYERFEKIENRLDNHDKRFNSISTEMHFEFVKVHQKLNELNSRIEFVNKSRTEDVDALADDIIAHDKRIKLLEKKVVRC